MPRSPRCPCGSYCISQASKIGHVCVPGGVPSRHHRTPEAVIERMVELRAQGWTLREIGEEMGISRQRVQQQLASVDIPTCRKCKLPGELVPGRRICADCHREMMANRPSKIARRTGYRKSSGRKRTSWIVRLAREGLTPQEIAERLGIRRDSVTSRLYTLRQKGHDIHAADGRKRKEESNGLGPS